uniref:hypothetical protein n=1 Tax=Ciborinia camelliae TaxID=647257 RepID=UPI001FA7B537|nr:hypothetical protein MRV96_mgp12 [Ciborinia camelliae]UNB14692.1 hypothetical protein [Ciborinia camelliae]
MVFLCNYTTSELHESFLYILGEGPNDNPSPSSQDLPDPINNNPSTSSQGLPGSTQGLQKVDWGIVSVEINRGFSRMVLIDWQDPYGESIRHIYGSFKGFVRVELILPNGEEWTGYCWPKESEYPSLFKYIPGAIGSGEEAKVYFPAPNNEDWRLANQKYSISSGDNQTVKIADRADVRCVWAEARAEDKACTWIRPKYVSWKN